MTSSSITEKTCTKCNLIKPVTDFYKSSRNKCGYNSHCIQCQRQYADEQSAKPLVVTPRLKQRFFKKVRKTSTCWLWIGAATRFGHGQLRINSKTFYAHRLSYLIHLGEIPHNQFVCHHCDIPNCVNPNHLFLGSSLDNNRDMIAKGRGRKAIGTENGNYCNPGRHIKLSLEKANEIRRLRRENNIRTSDLCARFNVTKTTICDVLKGRIWNPRNLL